MLFKQSDSTAAQRRWFFHCVDSVDLVTPETGLTFSGAELQISENGAAFADFGGTATELSDGLYYYEATAAELSTLGALAFKVEKTGVHTAIFQVGQVVPWDPYAVTNLGLTNLDATITSRLAPTVASRTLDVTATGEAGIDWGNIGSPTTVQGLSGTTVKTATDVETDTADIQARLPAALVSGRMDSSVGAMAANVVTASALAADAVTEIVAGFMAFSHDTGLTIKGFFRRLDALASGKATGLRSSVASYFMRDGSTEAIEAVQDSVQGTRAVADVTGSEA